MKGLNLSLGILHNLLAIFMFWVCSVSEHRVDEVGSFSVGVACLVAAAFYFWAYVID